MALDFILLGLLRRPTSGFDLKKILDGERRQFWAAELSQIYPTLKSLEIRGWLQSEVAAAKRGAGKRVYVITAAGRDALRHWLESGPEFPDERITYLAQLSFLGEMGDLRQTLTFLERARHHFVRKVAELEEVEGCWSESDPRYPDQMPLEEFHLQLTLSKGLSARRAALQWSEDAIARVRARIDAEQTSTSAAGGQ